MQDIIAHLSKDSRHVRDSTKGAGDAVGKAIRRLLDSLFKPGAKLASLKGIVWVGVGLFVFGLASLVYPPLKVVVASVTTSAALMFGGAALMVLPSLIVGNELLILGAVSIAVGAWFLAYRHGQLRRTVAASTGTSTGNPPPGPKTPTPNHVSRFTHHASRITFHVSRPMNTNLNSAAPSLRAISVECWTTIAGARKCTSRSTGSLTAGKACPQPSGPLSRLRPDLPPAPDGGLATADSRLTRGQASSRAPARSFHADLDLFCASELDHTSA